MYITIDILQKRGACQEALDFFSKHFPEGVEMLHMIEHGHIPEHFLHWGYQHLDPNEQEIAAYWKKVKVVNSQGVHESYDVAQSTLVSQSKYISNSERVHDSEQVDKSELVISSKFISGSDHIARSEFIDDSNYIVGCQNVNESSQIIDSVYIMNSHGVFESSNIINSHAIWKSENLTNCNFCFNCHNLTNALFCENVTDDECYLFNKKIDKARFDMIEKQYQRYAKNFITLMDKWPEDGKHSPAKYYDYRKHTKQIPESFWAWVKTLPGYNSDILYSITFNPLFLK